LFLIFTTKFPPFIAADAYQAPSFMAHCCHCRSRLFVVLVVLLVILSLFLFSSLCIVIRLIVVFNPNKFPSHISYVTAHTIPCPFIIGLSLSSSSSLLELSLFSISMKIIIAVFVDVVIIIAILLLSLSKSTPPTLP